MFRLSRIFVVCLAVFFLPPSGYAREKASTSVEKSGKQSPTKEAPARVVYSSNPVVGSAAASGVKTCLERIDQVSTFVASGANTGAFLFSAPTNADKQIFAASMEMMAENLTAYISASFAPSASGCSATYDAVTYWPLDCQKTAETEFAKLRFIGMLKGKIQILDGGPSIRVFLMPADKGCVAIKKEVVFE